MAPGFDHTGTGLVVESSVAIGVGDVSLTLSTPVHCVGSTPVSALSHGYGLDGNDPLPRHIYGISFIIMSRNGRSSLVLRDDHSLMGGSDDMKSDVNIVEIGQFGGLHFYVSGIGHGFVH